ncbi:MAG TPA: hypothetical protein VM077_02630 [Candidatus Limnocylindrales bacterium]|nr:hypothetical protein [Candidatus Limnocylindrales bacterium]
MAISQEALSRPINIKEVNMDAKFPRFRAVRPLMVGEDGSLQVGRRRFSFTSEKVGDAVSRVVDERVAGVKMPGRKVAWINGDTSEASRGSVSVTLLDRSSHEVPLSSKKDLVFFPTARQLSRAVRHRVSF